MRRHPLLTRLAAALAAGAMLSPLPALAAAVPALGATPAAHGGVREPWQPRPATYPGTVTQKDLAIPMSDGTVLRGDLTLPADADGRAVEGRFPVIVTITAYNKATGGFGGLAGGGSSFLVQRGYAQLTVDARGTGSSEGEWAAFSRREDQDAGEVVEWAHSRRRPWSDGRIGMSGPSYLGISQIFAAGSRPAGLKAIFPQVPAADVYRDVVASGGAIDVGFIPLWLGLVTGTSVIPPQVAATDPQSGLGALFSHVTTAATFTVPLMLEALLGDEPAYDGTFYDDRSPDRVIGRVTVPTFLVGGEFDIFQRGTPLLFENLRERGVPTKMIIGPWDHIQGSSGAEIGKAGYGSLSELQLRWFDRYVRGAPDPTLDRDIPPLTYYEQGSGRWTTGKQWIGKQRAATFRLSGPATAGGGHGVLTSGPAADGTAYVPPVPVSGLCTRSTNRRMAGRVAPRPGHEAHPLPRRPGDPALPPLHEGRPEAARQWRGRAGRRRGLPDRGLDRAGPPAADRGAGLRRAAPAADGADPAGDARRADDPQLGGVPLRAHGAASVIRCSIASSRSRSRAGSSSTRCRRTASAC